jgi:predicted esterase
MTLRTSGTRTRSSIATTTALFAVVLAACSTPPDRAATDDYPVFTAEATDDDVAEIAHSQNLVTDMELPAQEVRWVWAAPRV